MSRGSGSVTQLQEAQQNVAGVLPLGGLKLQWHPCIAWGCSIQMQCEQYIVAGSLS